MAQLSFNLSSRPADGGGWSKVPTILFFVLFSGGAVFLTWAFARDEFAAIQTWRWITTPCMITSAAVPNLKKPYMAEISYRYRYAGRPYTGSTISRDYRGDSDYYVAQKGIEAFPVGSQSVCRVDPENPGNAVLRIRSAWTLALMLMPLVFIAAGGAGIYWTLWPLDTTRWVANRGSVLMVGICTAFFLAGSATLLFAFLPGVRRARAVGTWPATACEILHSGVENHSGDNGTTYSIDVLYRYEFDRREHFSSRCTPNSVATSNYDSHQAAAAELARQKRQTCYVNPDDPDDAVLKREDGGWAWLTGIMGGTFTLIGAVGIGSAVWFKLRRKGLAAWPPFSHGLFRGEPARVAPPRRR